MLAKCCFALLEIDGFERFSAVYTSIMSGLCGTFATSLVFGSSYAYHLVFILNAWGVCIANACIFTVYWASS